MKPQVYIDPRPVEFFDKYHARTRTRRPDWVYRTARIVLTPPVLGMYRYRAIDVANVPERGPVLLAPNHFSFLDHFFVAVLQRREVQFMAKSQLFKPPVLGEECLGGAAIMSLQDAEDSCTTATRHAASSRSAARASSTAR